MGSNHSAPARGTRGEPLRELCDHRPEAARGGQAESGGRRARGRLATHAAATHGPITLTPSCGSFAGSEPNLPPIDLKQAARTSLSLKSANVSLMGVTAGRILVHVDRPQGAGREVLVDQAGSTTGRYVRAWSWTTNAICRHGATPHRCPVSRERRHVANKASERDRRQSVLVVAGSTARSAARATDTRWSSPSSRDACPGAGYSADVFSRSKRRSRRRKLVA